MCNKQAEMFKVLGVESRLKIIQLLKERGPLGVNDLAEELGLTPSAVSQHLKVLRHAGFVRSERKGYWIPYDVDASALHGCHEMLAVVCACHLGGRHGRHHHAKPGESPEKELSRLKRHEQELEKHLNEIRAKIEKLKGEE
jgi:DNA-binding transcriptional ArsR family regulator